MTKLLLSPIFILLSLFVLQAQNLKDGIKAILNITRLNWSQDYDTSSKLGIHFCGIANYSLD